jgi:hypothetical protein
MPEYAPDVQISECPEWCENAHDDTVQDDAGRIAHFGEWAGVEFLKPGGWEEEPIFCVRPMVTEDGESAVGVYVQDKYGDEALLTVVTGDQLAQFIAKATNAHEMAERWVRHG